MYVIRLPNGNLLVPESVAGDGGLLMSDAYVEIGPDDADCPPGVRMLLMRPDAAQRVTVFGSTRNRAATSPGVSSRSLLPSILATPPDLLRSLS